MKILITILIVSLNTFVFAQDTYTINGHFPKFPNSNFELKGYEGFQKKVLLKTTSNEEGKFVLTYPADYVGVAQLYMNGAYSNLLFLNKENSTIYWEDLMDRDAMQLSGNQEYDAFLKGMKIFQDSEAKLAAWHYLVPLYAKDSLKQKQYAQELDVVSNRFPAYIKTLPDSLFVRQYLLTKGLIEQMPKSVETYGWRAPLHVPEFMAIDFKALKYSGLYKEIIEGYTSLVERFPLEEVFPLLNQAIDKVVEELKDEPTIRQEIAHYWSGLLKSKSLFAAAEHLELVSPRSDDNTNGK